MAEQLKIAGTQKTAMVRSPLRIGVWSVVTLRICTFFPNRETADLARAHRTTVKGFLAITAAAMVVLLVAASGAQASHALSPARYAALDAAFTALIPLEKERVPASALAAAKAACNRLDRSDPLLRPIRDGCYAVVRIHKAGQRAERCRAPSGCLRAVAGMREALNIGIASARRADRAVDLFVSDPACRSALRTSPKDLRDLRRLATGFRLLERALRTGSRTTLRRAERLIDAVDDPRPSLRQALEHFRTACG